MSSHSRVNVALRKESVDRNCPHSLLIFARLWSLSARRAWIEISVVEYFVSWVSVALRKESVDRNFMSPLRTWRACVALRKESVDRNRRHEDGSLRLDTSLSARRAWIEMPSTRMAVSTTFRSLSARRAWIEITIPRTPSLQIPVALRKESVDRNTNSVLNA